MGSFILPISVSLQSLAERYQLDPLRVLEAIEEELTAASEGHIVLDDSMIAPDLKTVANEQGVTPCVVFMALETEMYYRSLSQARSHLVY